MEVTPDQLKSARTALKLTQRGFAERTGMSKKAISNWEQGERNIPPWVPKFIELLKEDGQ